MLTEALAAVTATGEGRLVLISGEAGIGKTALVQEFTAGLDGVRSLSGACEALTTPRPLGPLHDIAAETAVELPLHLRAPRESASEGARRCSPSWARPPCSGSVQLVGGRASSLPAR